MRPHYDYDVAVSFAGEDREIVETIASRLAEAGYSVFYDLWETATLLGKDLLAHLDLVYREQSRYCIVFVSSSYSRKLWTLHELRSALTRALEERSDYVLPFRIDDTLLPGLHSTIAYLDLRTHSIDYVISVLMEKLGYARGRFSIEEALAHGDNAHRISALTRLSFEKDSRFLPRLRALLIADPDAEIRARAAWAIDSFRDIDSKPALLSALQDTDWNVRSNSGWALVHLQDAAVDDVRKAFQETTNEGARGMALLILERIGMQNS